MNNRNKIKVEIITPTHVGAGKDNEWIRGADYIVKDGKVFVVDFQKTVEHGIDIDALSDILFQTDDIRLCKLLDGDLESVSKYIFPLPEKSSNPIKSFLRNKLHNRPLIAGSSLKGAIRSILFTHFRTSEKDCNSVLGSLKDNTDFMRFIQIGDVELESTALVNSRLFNLWKEKNNEIWHSGWKHANNFTSREFLPMGFNTLYECVLPEMTGEGNIKFCVDAFNTVLSDDRISKKIKYVNEKSKLLSSGTEHLFSIINDATWNYLLKEKEFFSHYDEAERTDEIIEHIDYLLDQIPDKDDNRYCLLKMSAGSGFHSITGDWQYDDYTKTGFITKYVKSQQINIPKYKSRKIVEYNGQLQLMGFVKLTCM